MLILVLIWLFQYVFLDSYYQTAKVRDIQKAAKEITESFDSDDRDDIIRRLAFENSLCVLITDEMGNKVILENNIGSFSVFNSDLNKNWGMFIFEMKSQLNKQKTDYVTQINQNENVKSKEIFYCTKFYSKEDAETPLYLYVESTVDPIESTVKIIREQLIYITIILFELAFIITMFITKCTLNCI